MLPNHVSPNRQHKPIMIVAEAFDDEETHKGEPFCGTHGRFIKAQLHACGISPDDCHFSHVFQFPLPGGRIDSLLGPKTSAVEGWRALYASKYLDAKYQPELERLWAEVEMVNPNIVVALGNTPLWALGKKSGIKNYRGATMPVHGTRRKLIATYSAGAVIRQWNLRPIMWADLYKARQQATFPELRNPIHEIWLEPTVEDIKTFIEKFLPEGQPVSCDIETKRKTITEVGFANASGTHAICIPFYDRLKQSGNYWETLDEELEAWNLITEVLRTRPSFGQNFQYDMKYLWRTVGIPCPLFCDDTMILHHATQPEMEKGLGFLASVYTNNPSWKFMRKESDNAKIGDD